MLEKIAFDSNCPKCGNPTRHEFASEKLKDLLERNEPLKLFCLNCSHMFEPAEEERVNLGGYVKERLSSA